MYKRENKLHRDKLDCRLKYRSDSLHLTKSNADVSKDNVVKAETKALIKRDSLQTSSLRPSQGLQTPTSANQIYTKWACKYCTFENEKKKVTQFQSQHKCSMCGRYNLPNSVSPIELKWLRVSSIIMNNTFRHI